jgi:hypothetical protein
MKREKLRRLGLSRDVRAACSIFLEAQTALDSLPACSLSVPVLFETTGVARSEAGERTSAAPAASAKAFTTEPNGSAIRRKRYNPHEGSGKRSERAKPGPLPAFGQMRRSHALAPFIIRGGADASGDALRRQRRHQLGQSPFPVERMS